MDCMVHVNSKPHKTEVHKFAKPHGQPKTILQFHVAQDQCQTAKLHCIGCTKSKTAKRHGLHSPRKLKTTQHKLNCINFLSHVDSVKLNSIIFKTAKPNGLHEPHKLKTTSHKTEVHKFSKPCGQHKTELHNFQNRKAEWTA